MKPMMAGPYEGMFDSLDPSQSTPKYANLLQNVYAILKEQLGRPGFQGMGSQLGAGAAGQGVAQFTKTNGTEYTVAVVGGKFYTYNWSTAVWTESVTTAQLTTATITLATTGRVALVPFFDKLVVSDGVNTPWLWDGTSGGGLTKLTNVPVFYGPPTIYAGKLFGIKAANRDTIVWSEEADATLGYEQTDYDNSWQLMQTDQHPLVAIRGTNTSLYYWRERSTGAVTGLVDTDFRTNATHDGWPEVGTLSPWGILETSDGFLFPDADAQPHRLTIGGGMTDMWQGFAETLATVPRSTLTDALAIHYNPSPLNLLLLGLTETAQQYPSMWLVYRDADGKWLPSAIWRGFTCTASAMVKDATTGVPAWVHLSSDGYAYQHGNPDGSIWDDGFHAGTTAIQHIVQAMPLGPDVEREMHYDRMDVVTRGIGTMTLSVDYDTQRNTGSALSVTVTPTSTVGMVWNVSQWDAASWSSGPIERHTAVGWDTIGRWIRPRVSHQTAGEQFSFLRWQVRATPADDIPSTP